MACASAVDHLLRELTTFDTPIAVKQRSSVPPWRMPGNSTQARSFWRQWCAVERYHCGCWRWSTALTWCTPKRSWTSRHPFCPELRTVRTIGPVFAVRVEVVPAEVLGSQLQRVVGGAEDAGTVDFVSSKGGRAVYRTCKAEEAHNIVQLGTSSDVRAVAAARILCVRGGSRCVLQTGERPTRLTFAPCLHDHCAHSRAQ